MSVQHARVALSATLSPMTRSISQRELRNDSGDILRRVDQGETFIVTRNGTPVAEITPMHRHRFVPAQTVVDVFRGAPSVDAERFRSDLDAIASPDATPRA